MEGGPEIHLGSFNLLFPFQFCGGSCDGVVVMGKVWKVEEEVRVIIAIALHFIFLTSVDAIHTNPAQSYDKGPSNWSAMATL